MNNTDDIQEEVKRKNRVWAVFFYIAILFVGSTLFTFLVAAIVCAIKNLDHKTLFESFSTTDLDSYEKKYIEGNAISQGLGNLLGYLFSTIIVCFFMRYDLKDDFKRLKEDKNFYKTYIPLAAILGVVAMYLVDTLVGIGAPSSKNQSAIESIMSNGGAIYMIISTVILAPIVEELIYRKVIFCYFKKYSIAACYVFSALIFAAPHMITTNIGNIGIFMLQCITYVFSGLALAFVYHNGKENIYCSMAMHILNNLLAVIVFYLK